MDYYSFNINGSETDFRVLKFLVSFGSSFVKIISIILKIDVSKTLEASDRFSLQLEKIIDSINTMNKGK